MTQDAKKTFSAIGEQVKTIMSTPNNSAPNQTTATVPQAQASPANTATTPVAPTNPTQPVVQPTAPAADTKKVVKLKVDGVEREVDETDVLEYGKKMYGLDAHYTRKGQMLADAEKELARERAEFERRREQDANKLREVFAEREQIDAERQRIQREEEELQRLEQDDPIQAKFVKENRSLRNELSSIKKTLETEVGGIKAKFMQEEESAKERRQAEHIANIKAAAQSNGVKFGDIVGYFVEHPEEADPNAAALKIVEERRLDVQRMVDEEKAKTIEQTGNAHAQNRVPAGVTGIPRPSPTGEKMPELTWKNRTKVTDFIVDKLQESIKDF